MAQLRANLGPSWPQVGAKLAFLSDKLPLICIWANIAKTFKNKLFLMILVISGPQMEAMLGQIGVMLGYAGHLGAFFFHLKLHVG